LVLLVDYLTAHGVLNACSGELTFAEVGQNALAAGFVAQAHPLADHSRLFLMGWSRGGGGVLAALADEDDGQSPFRGTIAIYPGCEDLQPWPTDRRVLLLLGEEDDITPPSVCRSFVERLADGRNVIVRRYARARHGFDNPELPALLAIGAGLTLGFDSVAAASAWDEIDEFLTR
jgi:dienelactone hydrolase